MYRFEPQLETHLKVAAKYGSLAILEHIFPLAKDSLAALQTIFQDAVSAGHLPVVQWAVLKGVRSTPMSKICQLRPTAAVLRYILHNWDMLSCNDPEDKDIEPHLLAATHNARDAEVHKCAHALCTSRLFP